MNTPMRRRRVRCCERAASGHAAAAPPSVTTNSRRPMWIAMRLSHGGHATERTISHLDVLRCGIPNRPMSAGGSIREATFFVLLSALASCGHNAPWFTAAVCHERT